MKIANVSIDFIRDFISKQDWIFAKTYANKAPHEYCLLKKVVGSSNDFFAFVAYIQEHGIKMNYWTMENTYLILDGWMYWTMDPTVDETILVNRCKLEDYKLSISWRGPKK